MMTTTKQVRTCLVYCHTCCLEALHAQSHGTQATHHYLPVKRRSQHDVATEGPVAFALSPVKLSPFQLSAASLRRALPPLCFAWSFATDLAAWLVELVHDALPGLIVLLCTTSDCVGIVRIAERAIEISNLPILLGFLFCEKTSSDCKCQMLFGKRIAARRHAPYTH